jgi:[ribosomal protein S18]-alanine N-acetyltransferase
MTAVAPNTLQIRLAVREDVPAMHAIEQASFSDPWTEETIRSALSLERMRVLVAEEWGGEGGDSVCRLAGYVVALVVGDEGEIADLAVAPEARRRGLGRALIDRMLADLAELGVRSLYLEVRESNHAARTLYDSRGFRPIGRRRGYYRHPVEDALLLTREIAPT